MFAKQKLIHYKWLPYFIVLLLFYSIILWMFRNTGLICDEKEHFNQILNFTEGDFHLLEISALPGYHAFMAISSKIFGFTGLLAVRTVNLIFGCLSVIIFYRIFQIIKPDQSLIRTLQFALFPPILIYFYVVYTDTLSLTFILLTLLFFFKKKYRLAGLFGILSMFIRQNNVVWVLMFPTLTYIEGFKGEYSVNKATSFIKKTWVFFLGIGLFISFVIVNKGIAMGDASSHPPFRFSTGNLFFLLFCFFLFFFPIHIANIPKIIRLLKKSKWTLILSICFVIIYQLTFNNDHPYNNISPDYFIRNYILMHFTASPLMKAIFLIPILFAFWSLIVTKLSRKLWYLFYFFTFLFLLPSWLIEQRYYIIPFTLFILFRDGQSLLTERVTVIYNIILLFILIPMITNSSHFL